MPYCSITNMNLMADPAKLRTAIMVAIREDARANIENYDAHPVPIEIKQELNREVNPRAFRIHPQGRRILVVLDPVPDRVGHIALPEEYRSREKMGAGIVMAVGPEVGQPAPFPGAPILEKPEELLYAHVVFGMHAGNVLRLDILDDAYHSGIIVMTDRDIWGIVSTML